MTISWLVRLLAATQMLLCGTTGYLIPLHVDEYDHQQHVLDQYATAQTDRHLLLSPLKNGRSKFQTGFVAMGDSYSAGIGTGFKGKEDDCRHGLGAYPQLIARDLAVSQGRANITSAQLLSCTGATTQDVLAGGQGSQIDNFDASLPADFGLLSLGGNDLGFFEVMNSCVFRFYSFYSGTCETALEHSKASIESSEFTNKLEMAITEILDKVRWEKKPWFFITMTGYARFFNEITDECDDMSFGVWWNGPKLTKELRMRMNNLVKAVNNKIRTTVDTINSKFTTDKVLFVDYDHKFDGHRFCEPNVVEPAYNRTDTWFFLVGGVDNVRNGTNATQPHYPQVANTVNHMPLRQGAAIDLVNPATCLEPAQQSGDWGTQALCYMAMAKQRDPSLEFAPSIQALSGMGHADQDKLFTGKSMWYVPTYYGKTFHPRTRGHEAIRDAVYEAWRRLEE